LKIRIVSTTNKFPLNQVTLLQGKYDIPEWGRVAGDDDQLGLAVA
jgi:hypothetical protein